MGNGQTILRDAELMMIFEVELECPVRHFEHDVVTVSGVSMQEHSLLPLFIVTHLRQIAVHVFGKEVNNFKLSPCLRRWMADRIFNACPSFVLMMNQLQESVVVV